MDYLIRIKAEDKFLDQAAGLHVKHLSYGGFITLFGAKFIKEIYRDLLEQQLGFIILAVEGSDLCGFALGCLDTSKLFTVIKRKFLKYLRIMLPYIIKRPLLIPKLFETLFYTRKEN